MKKEEIEKVRDFYLNVIKQGIIKPIEINDIYLIIFPETENVKGIAYKLKMRAISVYVMNKQKEVLNNLEQVFNDFDEQYKSKAMSTIENDVNSTHHEDDERTIIFNSDEGLVEIDNVVTKVHMNDVLTPYGELKQLEAEYEQATDSNTKRSISMKINYLKKKMNEDE